MFDTYARSDSADREIPTGPVPGNLDHQPRERLQPFPAGFLDFETHTYIISGRQLGQILVYFSFS